MDISKGTIIRTAVFVLGIVNFILVREGYSVLPIDEAWIESVVADVWLIGSAIVGFWKNNSFTKAAIEADGIMKAIKIVAKHGAECVEELSNGKGEDNE